MLDHLVMIFTHEIIFFHSYFLLLLKNFSNLIRKYRKNFLKNYLHKK